MSKAIIALIVPLGDSPVDPGFGGGIGAIGGHPDQGLPGGGGHPSHGLPGGGGHPSHPIAGVPPNVIWPPSFPPSAGNLPAPPSAVIGNQLPVAPTHPIAPGAPLPEDAAFVAVYTVNKGWQSTVIKAPPTAGTPPTGAQPK